MDIAAGVAHSVSSVRWALSQRRRMPCCYPADPQLVMKRPMELACLMAVRNRLAAAIAHLELPPLSGG